MIYIYMMIITIIIILLNKSIVKILKMKINPFMILSFIWLILTWLSLIFSKYVGLYEISFSGLTLIFIFLFITGVIVLTSSKLFISSNIKKRNIITGINISNLKFLTSILFYFFIFSSVLYWTDVFSVIGFQNLIEKPWLLKNAIVERSINESILHLGRGISFTGSLLTITYMLTRKRKYLIYIFIYFILIFVNIQRDVILIKLIYLLTPLLILSNMSITKFARKYAFIGVIFIIFFIFTYEILNFGNDSILIGLSRYSFGSFSSLQYILDNGYPINTTLPLGNTLWFMYSILKFINPNLAPPNVILTSDTRQIVNVYTALSSIIIDANGDMLMLYVLLFFYSLYVGIIISIGSIIIKKRMSVFSILIYTTIFSLVTRSFLNPTFSYLELYLNILYAMIFSWIIHKQNARDK